MATAIVWFRNNLRLHDNEARHRASKYDTVLPVYVFDKHWFSETSFEFPKTGSHRARFLLETLQNLRDNLQRLGSDLIVRQGKTDDILAELAAVHEAPIIFTEKEVASEEVAIEEAVEKYDTKGEYVRHWLPELADVPQEFIHEPHRMAVEQQKLAGAKIGEDYPEPMIDLEASYEEIRNRA